MPKKRTTYSEKLFGPYRAPETPRAFKDVPKAQGFAQRLRTQKQFMNQMTGKQSRVDSFTRASGIAISAPFIGATAAIEFWNNQLKKLRKKK